jgi:ADP-heptose:LPS heptosyltransferase
MDPKWWQPKRIVVLQLCPLGDTLFGTPAVRALRDQYPQAELLAVTWKTNCCVMAGNPAVDHLYSVKNTIEAVRLLRHLQTRSVDLAVGLSHRGSALLAFVKAQRKVGFNAQYLGWLYRGEVPDRRNIHAVEYCLDLLSPLGIEHPVRSRLEFHYTQQDLNLAERFLEAYRGYPVVAIHPGGKFFPEKRWHAKGFAQVADYFMGRLKTKVVFVGGKDDEPLAHEITSQMRHQSLIAAGRTSLGETAAIISRSDLFLGNDSAPQHLASAVGTPVVSLFGPTDPANFYPWGVPHRIVRCALDCSPCFHWLGSPLQYLPAWDNPTCQRECMQSITAQDVIEKAEELWQETAGGTGTKI